MGGATLMEELAGPVGAPWSDCIISQAHKTDASRFNPEIHSTYASHHARACLCIDTYWLIFPCLLYKCTLHAEGICLCSLFCFWNKAVYQRGTGDGTPKSALETSLGQSLGAKQRQSSVEGNQWRHRSKSISLPTSHLLHTRNVLLSLFNRFTWNAFRLSTSITTMLMLVH